MRMPLKNTAEKIILTLVLILGLVTAGAQDLLTPMQKKNYSAPTTYAELSAFVQQLQGVSPFLKIEIFGRSAGGKDLYAFKFSSSEFGKDRSKLRVLIFAQQHGNEQSGKDGALLLALKLLAPDNSHLLERLDIMLIPLMNPDGSEINRRRNGNGADLNRNHLILTEPETVALHKLFDKYLFEVTMDVHEYSPYGDTWKKLGYRDNSDELVGTPTNISVSKDIRDLANLDFVPWLRKYCAAVNVSCFIYTPGGPPEIDYIRHSTFDVNDGRQSFAIQNTFSFILEGKNGEDDFVINIKHRAESQMTAMMGLLEYAYRKSVRIRSLVSSERKKLIAGKTADKVPVQLIHSSDGETLPLPVYSYHSGKDSVITVHDYRPVVKSLYDVTRPEGYLVPKSDKNLSDWIARCAFRTESPHFGASYRLEQYFVTSLDSIDFEGDKVINPVLTVKHLAADLQAENYIYIPTAQLKGNFLVIALEPKSMLGLATYSLFSYLVKAGTDYPVLRVVKVQK